MTDLNLTQDEIDLILHNRAIAEKARKNDEFRKRVIKVAHDWLEWSEKEGYGLTSSTFVHQFGFDEIGASIYYRAIKEILDILKKYECPEEYEDE